MSEAVSPAVTNAQQTEHYPSRSIEIVHFQNADIIINKDADRVAWADKLAELFKDGVPEGWEVLSPEIDTELANKPTDYEVGPKQGMAKGTVDGVEFLLKPKAHFRDATDYLQTRTRYEDRETIKFRQRMNSVLNEMGLAREVKELAASAEMQNIAKKYDYRGIRLVEPIIAVLYRDTGRKYLVYEYIPDTEEVFEALMNRRDFAANDAFDADLKEFFTANGIEANELDTGHLLVDRDNMLNIVDIENYQKKATSIS